MLTSKQLEVLHRLSKGPLALEEIQGHDNRTLSSLEDHGLADIQATEATITAKGREALTGLPPRYSKRPRPAPAPAATTKPNGHGQITAAAIAELRAQIQARYDADLAALDRLAAIATAIEQDAAV